MSLPAIIGGVTSTTAETITPLASQTTGAMFNLRVTNGAAVTREIDVKLGAYFVMKDEVIPASGTVEITGLAIATETCTVVVDGADVTAVAYGVLL